jgi:hypothetical protein
MNGTGQQAPSTAQTNTGSNAPAQAQSNTTNPPPSNQAQQAPANSTAQQQPSTNAPANSTAQQQQPNSNAPASSTAQQQQPSGNAPANSTAQQQPSSSTQQSAQTSNTNVNASVNLNEQQRVRVSQTFARLDVKPLTNVNFNVAVGVVVPRDIRLEVVPTEIVDIVPQFRGFRFFAVRDQFVIVEPSSLKIVAVLPRSGGGSAAVQSRSKLTLSERDREVIRKRPRAHAEARTTGSSSAQLRIGQRVPDSVEIRSFEEPVYRDVPAIREYRYIESGPRTYIVEPQGRTVIEQID